MTKDIHQSICALNKFQTYKRKHLPLVVPSGLSDRNLSEILTLLLEAGASPSMQIGLLFEHAGIA